MEPVEYLATLRRRWVVILVLAVVGAAVAYAYASTLPVLYRSTSSVFVASQRGETTTELVQGSTFAQDQVQSYAQLAPLPKVLQPVIDQLDLNTTPQKLADSVTADIRLNTVIIDVSVSDPSPQRAAAIADAVTASLGDVVEGLSPQGPNGQSAITMTTVSSASVPLHAFSPNSRLIVLTGLLVGLASGVIYALSRDALDTRVRSEKDLARVSEVPILGTIARRKDKDSTSIVMRATPYSPAAEDFRRLGTNLEFADIDHPVRSVVITSSLPSEGKTTTAVNLALAMAERVQSVLLIDADLRKPSVADYCQIDGAVGLTSVLVGSASIGEAVKPWGGGIIHVLPSGVVPANPSQMLGSDAMAALMEVLTAQYDFVVLDSPPLLPVTDALTLSKLTDGAIVISRFKSTRRQQLEKSLQSLNVVNARTLGLVLNGVKSKGATAYYGYQADGPPNGTGSGSAGAAVSAPVERPASPEPSTVSNQTERVVMSGEELGGGGPQPKPMRIFELGKAPRVAHPGGATGAEAGRSKPQSRRPGEHS